MRAISLLTLVVALNLASCGGSNESSKKPEGQVVAVVDGEEVTLRELSTELRSVSIQDPALLKLAEQKALEAIVNRKIFANAAREQGIDENPDFRLTQRRAEELLLAQEVQRQITARTPRPTRDEAARYVAAHPNNFAQRKIYSVNQIQFSLTGKRDKLREFASLKTLDAVEGKLLAEGIEYQKGPGSIDSQTVPPEIANRIAAVPAGEVFLVPNGEAAVAVQITAARVAPLSGEPAVAHAQNLLFRQRVAKAMQQRAEELRKAAGPVSYKEGYGPPASAPNASGANRTAAAPPS
jgi:EpsD family peptidyl-prolyl cis-trans isomerase